MSPKLISDLQVWTYSDALCGRNEWVERRHTMTELHLQLDFVRRAAVVSLSAEDLELD
jgi:hypothetical protein